MIDRILNVLSALILVFSAIVFSVTVYFSWHSVNEWDQEWVATSSDPTYTAEELTTALKRYRWNSRRASQIRDELNANYAKTGNVHRRFDENDIERMALNLVAPLLFLLVPISINYIRTGRVRVWNPSHPPERDRVTSDRRAESEAPTPEPPQSISLPEPDSGSGERAPIVGSPSSLDANEAALIDPEVTEASDVNNAGKRRDLTYWAARMSMFLLLGFVALAFLGVIFTPVGPLLILLASVCFLCAFLLSIWGSVGGLYRLLTSGSDDALRSSGKRSLLMSSPVLVIFIGIAWYSEYTDQSDPPGLADSSIRVSSYLPTCPFDLVLPSTPETQQVQTNGDGVTELLVSEPDFFSKIGCMTGAEVERFYGHRYAENDWLALGSLFLEKEGAEYVQKTTRSGPDSSETGETRVLSLIGYKDIDDEPWTYTIYVFMEPNSGGALLLQSAGPTALWPSKAFVQMLGSASVN